ncbi:MAG: PilZ domain-containing protein [Phycisphaerae bacterium]|nr:PilZ domain-containing protein [Phycisphaerae bacterium]
MLTTTESLSTAARPVPTTNRRLEAREELRCDLWMVDHNGATVLRCRCVDASEHGMRLRVPLGYGVAEGQRYELRSHLPGSTANSSLGLAAQRWATVVRTQIHLGGGDDHLDVGVVLDETPAGMQAWETTVPSV